jgi:diaminopimelate decarboxylase
MRQDEERLRVEIEEHLTLQTEEHLRAGLSPAEARRQAVLKFGAVEAIKDGYRDERGLPFLDTLFQDTRQALRRLRMAPAFSIATILTLALGIGANTAIFSLLYTVMLRTLPVSQPEQLVEIMQKYPSEPRGLGYWGWAEYGLRAGMPPRHMTLHGNNKSDAEIDRAVAAGIGRIVIDSLAEIGRVADAAARHGTRMPVLLRVTVGVEAHTHEYMSTAHEDQKFGLSLQGGVAAEAVRRVLARPELELRGLHAHIGSQIFDTGGFEVATRRLLGLHAEVARQHGIELPEVDLGGGFGIAYTDEDDAPVVKDLAQGLREIVDGQCRAAGLSRPRLTVEPGRAIVGPSTVALYTVGTIKDVDGLRTYVSVDGGMSDNIRTALYDASYLCALASRASDAPPMLSRVVGRHCESGDIVVRHAWLPADLAPGDLLAVPATGAYCRSLASNYNHVSRPAVIAVGAGAARPIVRRETLDDLLSLDCG